MSVAHISVTFGAGDRPEDCTLSTEDFNNWLDNNGSALLDHLIAAGNDWIETRLEIDGHMGEQQ